LLCLAVFLWTIHTGSVVSGDSFANDTAMMCQSLSRV